MSRFIRVAIETLGCKLNQAESEKLARQFTSAGCKIVGADSDTDVYILNTCTVTHIADRKCRQALRTARRRNTDALIIAAGCYINRSAGELEALKCVDLLVSNEDKFRLPDIVFEKIKLKPNAAGSADNVRTRAFIKAQDGCSRQCTYCIVPLVRGCEKSLPADEIIAEIKSRASEGCKEVVLTGTEIGSYSADGLGIKGLLERILGETGIERLRLSSLQTCEINPDLLSLWEDERLCSHFHISLQSGSDSVLRRMKRGYTKCGYEKAVGMIREMLPDVAITTDVIAGFPGETDEEFMETFDLCRKIGFARIHVFPYSPRPGTAALSMAGQGDSKVKKERAGVMLALAKESAKNFQSKFIDKKMGVLWEQKTEKDIWSGYTSNYIRVYSGSEQNLTNVIALIRLNRLYKDGIWGDIISSEEQI
jgi:threonylcarbamoyladenosine tRNA methylthiotransferase MtaB